MEELIKKSVHLTRRHNRALNILRQQRFEQTGRRPSARDLFIEAMFRLPGYTAIYKELIQEESNVKQEQTNNEHEGSPR